MQKYSIFKYSNIASLFLIITLITVVGILSEKRPKHRSFHGLNDLLLAPKLLPFVEVGKSAADIATKAVLMKQEIARSKLVTKGCKEKNDSKNTLWHPSKTIYWSR